MVPEYREGDAAQPVPVRSERFFNLHNFWFFATREGAAVGPYDSKPQAQAGVSDYIEFVTRADPSSLQFFTTGTKFGT
ncbi:DUF6316 family protein [Porticoccus sp. W117]|uniref:DUF6316 family protein n=1 Tax=Porticoccus sp. W117 TaxID=3054777 RepID=UPI00259868D6|nr:DUF6316 family protein [Porticoccus sp. W117]MDM3872074.1 DUF6316 family protein [Porticoccus sp. W117]